MSSVHVQRFDRSETFGHCRRVSALARRTSAILGLDPGIESALSIAASLHHFYGPNFAPGRLALLFESLPEFAAARPADNDILFLAERILIDFSAGTPDPAETVRVASSVLEVCNEFDEAVEFSALEGIHCAEAIREFHDETPRSMPATTPRSALCKATSATRLTITRDQLPVLPKAAAKLMRTSDDTAPATLESIVAWDPILTGRLLEVANSASFGPPRSVTRLADAAARVGVPLARKVLLAACLGELFASASLRILWVNSQRIAERTSALARLAKVDPDEAYVAGLLHDAGRLIFERSDAGSRLAVSEWLGSGFPLTCAETLVYAKDHADAGAELLRSWDLPCSIVDAVENHHRPERSGSPLTSLVFLAEQWHRTKCGEQEGPELHEKMRTACAGALTGITPNDLSETGVTHMLAAAI
jgi:putative nucleotidyltransferase with HDIG domain